MEQWLDDVLRDAEELNMPGVLKRPEHRNPLGRYEVDRMRLVNMGVAAGMIDRAYRGLFVHSLGFFGLIKDVTRGVTEGKAAVQANLWRVFQVLLEYSCKTEYRLVTQQIEESHLDEVAQLNETIAKL